MEKRVFVKREIDSGQSQDEKTFPVIATPLPLDIYQSRVVVMRAALAFLAPAARLHETCSGPVHSVRSSLWPRSNGSFGARGL